MFNNPQARLITLKQVADRMGVTTRTICRWNRLGDGPLRVQGKRTRPMYDPEDVERWIEERKALVGQEL